MPRLLICSKRRSFVTALACVVLALLAGHSALAQTNPIKIGLSMSLTGGLSPNGKQLLVGLEIWRDDVNANGGLLGRPVQLIHHDDQSNPSNVPGIYTKLISVDKADLLLGPYGANMVAPAMPVIMQNNKVIVSLLALGINRQFKYSKYFSMIPTGPEDAAFSRGFFELAAAQTPKPLTVALLSADAEFGRVAADGAKENAKALGFKVVYDRGYPPSTTDYSPIMRGVRAVNADLVFVAAYPPDTVGIIRAANEVGLAPRMFGGNLIGLLATSIKMQLGPLMNGLVFMETFAPAPSFNFPGVQDVLGKYRVRAYGLGIDPLGYAYAPWGYAAGQVIATAVTQTKSLNQDKLAAHMHNHSFQTVVGDVTFGKDGEWAVPRTLFSQFQNITNHDLDQFRDTNRQVVLWPDQHRTGNIIYPYAEARKK